MTHSSKCFVGKRLLSLALYKALRSFVDAHNVNMIIILNTLNDPYKIQIQFRINFLNHVHGKNVQNL